MDGSWQEVIYNLSLPCESVRQLRQTERDKKRQKQMDAPPQKKQTGTKKMKFLFFSEIFFFSLLRCAAPSQWMHLYKVWGGCQVEN